MVLIKINNHNKIMLDANFWQDKTRSKLILKEKNYLKI